MGNKRFLLRMLVMVLVFGITVVGCDNESTDKTYDATGVWNFNVSGQTATVTVSGNTWIFSGPAGVNDDTGVFHQNGNTATLYSNSWKANIGNATLTSNTTMVLTLFSPSAIVGTFNGTKN